MTDDLLKFKEKLIFVKGNGAIFLFAVSDNHYTMWGNIANNHYYSIVYEL